MKLRIRGDSLRLRLTRPEVLAVGRGEPVRELVHFAPGEQLGYSLECGGEAITARLQGGQVTVRVPTATAAEWCMSDRVGLSAEQSVADGTALRILIEKDFACLTGRDGEDDKDAFPNPHERC